MSAAVVAAGFNANHGKSCGSKQETYEIVDHV
jgi:hypothetical protein